MVATLANTLRQGFCRTRLLQPAATSPVLSSGQPQTKQVWLAPGEVVQFDGNEYRVRVLSGRIWVAYAGRERILYSGEELWVGRHQSPATLWTLMRQPALVEWRRL
jgi:hypothetical protein